MVSPPQPRVLHASRGLLHQPRLACDPDSEDEIALALAGPDAHKLAVVVLVGPGSVL
jgi:hypothetical protein